MFEFSFPRFAYRWKYVGRRNTQLFLHGLMLFLFPDLLSMVSYDAYNEGMVNNLRKLTLSGFETPPADVDRVEILYKDSSENIIYRIDDQLGISVFCGNYVRGSCKRYRF
jgi:hypothetical protein